MTEWDQHRVIVKSHPLHVIHYDSPYLGAVRTYLHKFVGLFLILYDKEGRIGMIQDIFDLIYVTVGENSDGGATQ